VIAIMVAIMVAVMVPIMISVPPRFDDKIGAATAVYPKLISVLAPRLALDTLRIAALAREAGPATGSDVAEVAPHVVGGASNRSRRVAAVVPSAAGHDFEIGSATAIDPELIAANTVAISLDALGITALAYHSNIASVMVRPDGTGVVAHVVGRATNHGSLGQSQRRERHRVQGSDQKGANNLSG
jgi:hypothetical protein